MDMAQPRWNTSPPDYYLVKKQFRSDIKTARTRTFPGAELEATLHEDDDFPDTL